MLDPKQFEQAFRDWAGDMLKRLKNCLSTPLQALRVSWLLLCWNR